ncbi:hypothetical protein [Gelatiniphilus marinus]|uniref:Uncharacterized protein n=1 Tax=Gelatiniphilus marinus TaxID=1759464 RepID=A0ABW5JWG6_9FLAO
MEKDIKKILLIGLGLTLLFLTIAFLFFQNLNLKPEQLFQSYKFQFDVLQTIIVGFLIAIIGLIVPQLLARAKYNFEFLKEGKKLFSEVKTGIDYLPYKIPFLNFNEALTLIENLHQKKHLVDLYEDDKGRKYKDYFNQYKAYEKLTEIRELIKTEEFNNEESQIEKMVKIEGILKKHTYKKS